MHFILRLAAAVVTFDTESPVCRRHCLTLDFMQVKETQFQSNASNGNDEQNQVERNKFVSKLAATSTTFPPRNFHFVRDSSLLTVSGGLITLSANIPGPGFILCSGTIIAERWEQNNNSKHGAALMSHWTHVTGLRSFY